MKLNFETYKDKVRACWIGKNIGGTLGGPYEGGGSERDRGDLVQNQAMRLPRS